MVHPELRNELFLDKHESKKDWLISFASNIVFLENRKHKDLIDICQMVL